MPDTLPTINNEPAQGIQTLLDTVYLWNPDVANELIEQVNELLEELGDFADAGCIKPYDELTAPVRQYLPCYNGDNVYVASADIEELPEQFNPAQWTLIATKAPVLQAGAGIDINGNEISVEQQVLSDAAAGATAVQPEDLGTAAYASTSDFATAAQGGKADTAVQPADLAAVATSGSYTDLSNKPAIDGVTLTSQTTKADIGLAGVYKYKGSVATYADLANIQNPDVGDVYNVEDTGDNYAWNGTEWDQLGGMFIPPVTSVNSKTGAVVLSAEDVGAVPQYTTMPTANASNVAEICQFAGNQPTVPASATISQTTGSGLTDLAVDIATFEGAEQPTGDETVAFTASVTPDTSVVVEATPGLDYTFDGEQVMDYFNSIWGYHAENMNDYVWGIDYVVYTGTGSGWVVSRNQDGSDEWSVALPTGITVNGTPTVGDYIKISNTMGGTTWTKGGNTVTLGDYGVSFTGNPTDGDVLTVVYTAEIPGYDTGYFYVNTPTYTDSSATISQTTGTTDSISFETLAGSTEMTGTTDALRRFMSYAGITPDVSNTITFTYNSGSLWECERDSVVLYSTATDTLQDLGFVITGTPQTNDSIACTYTLGNMYDISVDVATFESAEQPSGDETVAFTANVQNYICEIQSSDWAGGAEIDVETTIDKLDSMFGWKQTFVDGGRLEITLTCDSIDSGDPDNNQWTIALFVVGAGSTAMGASQSDLLTQYGIRILGDPAVGNVLVAYGYYEGTVWEKDNVAVNIADYGISFTGAPNDGDVLTVAYIAPAISGYSWQQIDVQPNLGENIEYTDVDYVYGVDPYEMSMYVELENLPTGDYYFYVKSLKDTYTSAGDSRGYQTNKISFHWDSSWNGNDVYPLVKAILVSPVLDGDYIGSVDNMNTFTLNGQSPVDVHFNYNTDNKFAIKLAAGMCSTTNYFYDGASAAYKVSKLYGGAKPKALTPNKIDRYGSISGYDTYTGAGGNLSIIPQQILPDKVITNGFSVASFSQTDYVLRLYGANFQNHTTSTAKLVLACKFSQGEFRGELAFCPGKGSRQRIISATGAFNASRFYGRVSTGSVYLSLDNAAFSELLDQNETIYVSVSIMGATGAESAGANILTDPLLVASSTVFPFEVSGPTYVLDTPTIYEYQGVVQYVGETDSNYTKGYFYKAEGDVVSVLPSLTCTETSSTGTSITCFGSDANNLIDAIMSYTGWQRETAVNYVNNPDYVWEYNVDYGTLFWGALGGVDSSWLQYFVFSPTPVSGIINFRTSNYQDWHEELQNGHWARADVQPQPADPLPSQQGQSGKYLKTNGSTVSWDSPVPDAPSGGVTSVLTSTRGTMQWLSQFVTSVNSFCGDVGLYAYDIPQAVISPEEMEEPNEYHLRRSYQYLGATDEDFTHGHFYEAYVTSEWQINATTTSQDIFIDAFDRQAWAQDWQGWYRFPEDWSTENITQTYRWDSTENQWYWVEESMFVGNELPFCEIYGSPANGDEIVVTYVPPAQIEYAWREMDLQLCLPSQNGQTGKFLCTNGTTPYWKAALSNSTTRTGSINILGDTSNYNYETILGVTAKATGADSVAVGYYARALTNSVAVGSNSNANQPNSVAVGYNASVTSNLSVAVGSNATANYGGAAIGYNSRASAYNAVAIGNTTQATADGAIQIGIGTNTDAGTLQVGLYQSWAVGAIQYRLLNKDGTIPTDRMTNAINKYAVMPAVSSVNEGAISQYVGADDALLGYTHGYIYENKAGTPAATITQIRGASLSDLTVNAATFATQTTSSGTYYFNFLAINGYWTNDSGTRIDLAEWGITYTGTPENQDKLEAVFDNGYRWVQINVQPGGGLSNDATGNNSLSILGVGTSRDNCVEVGKNANASDSQATVVGRSAQGGYDSTVSGYYASGAMYSAVYGYSATANYQDGIAYGREAISNAIGAIQIGKGTNADAGTLKIGQTTDGTNWTNVELLSANGTIPTARLTKVNTTVTLTTAGWSGGSQTVTVTGMTATGVVLVSPDPTDQSAYTSAGIICTAQAANSLTFTCTSTPSADIDVNVVML